jgi:hypothetical protein
VKSTQPDYKKTWLLQAMKPPTTAGTNLVVTNGEGRLYIQALLPADPVVQLVKGDDLYTLGGQTYLPDRDTGPAPECRMEVSPPTAAQTDYFLHVLTATDAATDFVPQAVAEVHDDRIAVTIGDARISFTTADVGGQIQIGSRVMPLACEVTSAP